jgi:predicted P-loop ATPase
LLAQTLLDNADEIVSEWLPDGRRRGQEWVCGDLTGGPGRSCSVNLTTGRWGEFEGDERGGDLISLYAAIKNKTQSEAYEILAKEHGNGNSESNDLDIGAPPQGVKGPRGAPSPLSWCYRDVGGAPLFCIYRQDKGRKKDFRQKSYSRAKGKWVWKGYPAPRPLYDLHMLAASKDAPVMVVEGEKCAEAAKKLVAGSYVVTTWACGATAYNATNWSPLHGRDVVIWPDNDKQGIKAGEAIARMLVEHGGTIRVIDPAGKPPKWDAADALEEGMSWAALKKWSDGRISIITKDEKTPRSEYSEAGKEFLIDPTDYRTDQDVWTAIGLDFNERGPAKNLATISRCLSKWVATAGKIWWDEFSQRVYTTWHNSGQESEPREWLDIDDFAMARAFQSGLAINVGDSTINKGVLLHAHDNQRCEIRDYLSGLEWDGTVRLDRFWEDCYGSEHSEYHRQTARNFWISMVARIFDPGCKCDTMVVLEGPQGAKKSMSLEVIATPRWYTEATENPETKDFYLGLHGKLLVEISELEAFDRATVSTIKRCLSCRSDRYRAPYGHVAADHPRRCIFVGTTNDDHYLRDVTGARRFWPIQCGEIDIELLKANRERYFAEAVAAYKAGETWWNVPQTEAERHQEARRQVDSWEELIGEWLGRVPPDKKLTMSTILTDGLRLEPGRQDFKHTLRVGRAMRKLGYLVTRGKVDGRTESVYRKAGEL